MRDSGSGSTPHQGAVEDVINTIRARAKHPRPFPDSDEVRTRDVFVDGETVQRLIEQDATTITRDCPICEVVDVMAVTDRLVGKLDGVTVWGADLTCRNCGIKSQTDSLFTVDLGRGWKCYRGFQPCGFSDVVK